MIAASMLRRARARSALSQRHLARRAGVPQSTVSRIESGSVSPTVDLLDRLLRSCDMELVAADRPGPGVDATLVRERLRMSPGDRAERTALEWRRTAPFRRAGTPSRTGAR